ncbi:glycosyltransferase [Undibacterium sp. CY18W]|uniref:Glycosyltransferase n=1 Tax=Undibacterium hunanense TaxID=2762292 RepID=A0ABR6ZWN9_9BURK|nr:glycosyltransferase [Undibacterium hunanense]MBC3920287.1 glycosyltransferase [Undibacterium hunanense]
MRILIDLQACQSTGSRDRGIGRYSLALAKAVANNAGQHDIWLMLSGLFPETIQPLRNIFADLVPSEQIVTWRTPAPVAELGPDNYWRNRTAELVREHALASIRPDFVHVTSLFEGSGDDAVSSVGLTDERLVTAVTLYDLIPLVYEKQYLQHPSQRAWYYRKLASLKRADLLLAISDFSRQEGIELLQLPSERVVNISSAVDEDFQLCMGTQEALSAKADLRKRYGLQRSFIMYTGGIDIRKNIEGLISAYAELPVALRQQYQLAIVCSVQDAVRQRLGALGRKLGLAEDDVVLTGFVPDADLPLLYQACALFVFPSWHEGFGLPALEAMSCGAPVIASNTSSLPEVLGCPEALFNPRDIKSIASKMVEVLQNPAFSEHLRQHGLMQAKKFSWDASAKKAIEAIQHSHAGQNAAVSARLTQHSHRTKPRLAYISPLPPMATGIANYSADLLPELADYYDISLICEQDEVVSPWLNANFSIRDINWFVRHADEFDRTVYHFGNSPAHAFMYPLFSDYPGVIVLHDYFLGDSLAHLEMSRQIPGIWTSHMYLSHAYAGLLERRDAKDEVALIRKFPCSGGLLDMAEGVIVHSAHAMELGRFWGTAQQTAHWKQVALLRKIPVQLDKRLAREALGLKEDDFVICSFGMLGATKLNQVLLETWLASSFAGDARCHLVFVGKNDAGSYGAKLQKDIQKCAAAGRISITGFIEPTAYSHYLQAADVAVQLRTYSRGETSAAVLECMAYGLPVIVNRNGSMAELPPDCVVSIADDFVPSELLKAIEQVRHDASGRQAMGQAARNMLQTQHAPALIARKYFEAIEWFSENEPSARLHRSLDAIAKVTPLSASLEDDLPELARCLVTQQRRTGKRLIMVDVSPWCQQGEPVPPGLKFLLEHLMLSRPDLRIETVLHDDHDFRYARSWTCKFLHLPELSLPDDIVEFQAGDFYLDLCGRKDLQNIAIRLRTHMLEINLAWTSIDITDTDISVDEDAIKAILAEFSRTVST